MSRQEQRELGPEDFDLETQSGAEQALAWQQVQIKALLAQMKFDEEKIKPVLREYSIYLLQHIQDKLDFYCPGTRATIEPVPDSTYLRAIVIRDEDDRVVNYARIQVYKPDSELGFRNVEILLSEATDGGNKVLNAREYSYFDIAELVGDVPLNRAERRERAELMIRQNHSNISEDKRQFQIESLKSHFSDHLEQLLEELADYYAASKEERKQFPSTIKKIYEEYPDFALLAHHDDLTILEIDDTDLIYVASTQLPHTIYFGCEFQFAFFDKQERICIKPIASDGREGSLKDLKSISNNTFASLLLHCLRFQYPRT